MGRLRTFTLLILVVIIISSIITPQGILSATSDEWETIENEYFIIYYRPGYIQDAYLISNISLQARNFTINAFPHELDTRVKVYLYDWDTWYGGVGTCYAYPEKPAIAFLTPSDVLPSYKKWIDDVWYLHAFVHEYTHIATLREAYLNNNEEYIPKWLSEGIAEYIALFRTTEEICERYMNAHAKYYGQVEDLVKRGDGYLLQIASDWYYRSPFVVMYMYETYGEDKMVELFHSLAEGNGLISTFQEVLNVSYIGFEANWLKWAIEHYNADPSLYPLLNVINASYDKLLIKYNRLFDEYKKLNASYNELNETYYELLKKYDNIQAEYENLYIAYLNLNSTYHKLLADYVYLKNKYNELNETYTLLTSAYHNITDLYIRLNMTYNQLLKNYIDLQAEYEKLRSSYYILNKTYHNLSSSFNDLKNNNNALKAEYRILNQSYYNLLAKYKSLQKEKQILENILIVVVILLISAIAGFSSYILRRHLI